MVALGPPRVDVGAVRMDTSASASSHLGSVVSGSRKGGDIVFFLGRWGREGDTVHGVQIVFHSMSTLQTDLIPILYKQSLQWWFRCMRLQTCVGSVCVVADGMCTVGFGNSTSLLLHVTGRWRSTSLTTLIRAQR